MADLDAPKLEQWGSALQVQRFGTTQTVTVDATSGQSTALESTTQIVRLYSDVKCHVVTGSNPTATTGDTPINADSPEYIQVTPGDKIAVIRATSDGTLHITECGS